MSNNISEETVNAIRRGAAAGLTTPQIAATLGIHKSTIRTKTMDVADRLEGIALMAENMKKLDPANFAREPISGFIDALAADLKNAATEWLDENE